MQRVAAKPDLLPRDNNTASAARGLDISELFAFSLSYAVRQSREIEKGRKNPRKGDMYVAESCGRVCDVQLFMLVPCVALRLKAWPKESRPSVRFRWGNQRAPCEARRTISWEGGGEGKVWVSSSCWTPLPPWWRQGSSAALSTASQCRGWRKTVL